MRHDLHHIYCDCGMAEFGEDCSEVAAYAQEISDPTACELCGARLMIRALEVQNLETTTAVLLSGMRATVYYRTSTPMPLVTWLAALTPERN